MLAQLEQYAAGRFQPATFLERGICLPFTTPMLLGARIRPSERRSAELILAHPAGGDGFYVLPWAGLPDVCSPTLHDRALWARIAQLPVLSPTTIREAARAVAAQGLAGRAAAKAAGRAEAAERESRTLTHYQLLLALVRQGEGATGLPPEHDTPANVQRRAHAILKRLRTEGGLPPAVAVEALEELAGVLEHCGLPGDPTRARLPRLVTTLGELAEATGHLAAEADGETRTASALVREGADTARRLGHTTVGDAQALAGDLWALMHRWRREPTTVANLAARPDWVLDGWETICGLWELSSAEMRQQVVIEMALLVPLLPSEARQWGGGSTEPIDVAQDGLRRWRRTVAPREDWMTGRRVDLTERSERLRLLAA